MQFFESAWTLIYHTMTSIAWIKVGRILRLLTLIKWFLLKGRCDYSSHAVQFPKSSSIVWTRRVDIYHGLTYQPSRIYPGILFFHFKLLGFIVCIIYTSLGGESRIKFVLSRGAREKHWRGTHLCISWWVVMSIVDHWNFIYL